MRGADRDPEIGDIWIKHAYKHVGYPAGRITVTDVVTTPKGTLVSYHYIAGSQIGKALTSDLPAFKRIYIHGSSPSPAPLPSADALPFAEHTEAYGGEEEL